MSNSTFDKRIISVISQDIPLVREPFRLLAKKVGIEESLLLSKIKAFKKKGIMRKFTAVLNHRKAGFKYNAMVVWNVPGKLINKVGNIIASFDEVSHCYQREKTPDWNYNLYSMVHARSRKECLEVTKKIHKRLGCKISHMALFSSREEKKSAAKF